MLQDDHLYPWAKEIMFAALMSASLLRSPEGSVAEPAGIEPLIMQLDSGLLDCDVLVCQDQQQDLQHSHTEPLFSLKLLNKRLLFLQE